MRRLLAITILLALGATGAALISSTRAQGSSTSRFDVIFDDARGLVGGQLVKIAGARAGTINNVVVTPNFKARIEATVDSRFMPFHRNATCTIRPEGLIAENYVDCDPGTADSPVLRGSGGHPPTVPVSKTTEPVSLLDLFNIFNLPTRQRFQVIIDELGIGTSARGQDLNAVLLRANPALALARKTISILNRQHAQLATIIDATNTIAAQGAGHTATLQSFLDRAAALTSLTAAHRGSIEQTIARLPRLLAVTQPALQQLDTVAVSGTPLLQQLQVAIPSLNRVSRDLGPFVKTAKPGLAKLSSAIAVAIPAIRHTTPLVRTLAAYTRRAKPGTLLVGRLFANLQRHGFIENFLGITYYITASLARFDTTSHLLALLLVGAQNGACGRYATKPVPGCSAHYGSQPPYKRSSTQTSHATAKATAARPAPRRHGAPPARAQSAPQQPASAAPAQPTITQRTDQAVQGLLNYLLR